MPPTLYNLRTLVFLEQWNRSGTNMWGASPRNIQVRTLQKKNFCSVFKSTWDDVMRQSTLKEAFRKSGIYPICRDQITDDQVRSSLVYSHSDQSTLPSNSACESPLPEPTRTPFVTSTMSTLSPPEQSASRCETSSLLPQVCESPLPQESEPLSLTSNPL